MPTPAEHFYPQADAELVPWGDQFNIYMLANFAALGLTATDSVNLNGAWINFRIRYAAHVKAQAAAVAATAAEAEARREYEAVLRPAVRRIQSNAAVTDAQRGALGITIPDRTRTRAAAPTSRPLVQVDFSRRLVHAIGFVDEGRPTRRARPRGVMGAEVWAKVAAPGEAPPDGAAELKFLLLATRSPAKVEYSGDEAGHTAHYMVRWLSRRGEPGPWSETASATVGA
jgi:hypothetical protein